MNNPIVYGNWNSGPAMRSFVGFESNSEKHQFSWDWETNNPLIIGTTNTEINHGLPCVHQQNSGEFSYSTLPSPLLYSQIPVGLIGNSSDYGGGVVKREGFGGQDHGRIGLNLGHRTYFSSQDNSSMINRLFRRSRGFLQPVPRCQAEGCRVDLTNAKHYHRRHKVCEFHSKATKVITGGLEQRFCQQCSRFHVLAEFDEEKRSCRKRLADHNRRRRKPQPGAEASSGKSVENGGSSHVSSVLRSEMKPMSPSPSLPLMRNCSNQVQQHKEPPPHQQCLQKDPALSLGGIEFETQSFSSSSREIATDLSPWISLIRFSKSSSSDFP